MTRTLQSSVALTAVLLFAGVSQAQTEKPCRIMFENLSRETFNIRQVSVLQADGNKKEFPGVWTYKPGDRSYLAHDKNVPVEGRQVFYTVELPDGVTSPRMSTTKLPLVLDYNFIVQTYHDDYLAGLRKEDKGRKLTKAEATYRYWNTVHGIQLEEAFEAVQNVGFLEIAKLAGYLRTMANRIDDLETAGIDGDAVAAAKTYSATLRQALKVMNGRNGARVAVMIGELYRLKVDTFGKILDENQRLAAKTEDLFQFMRSRRKALEKRYRLAFPRLTPPVGVGLSPYILSKGYYVVLTNSSGDDMKQVTIRYRDSAGNVKVQAVTNRLTFNPAPSPSNFTKVDPNDVNWRVEAGQWITVVYDGGAYSYPTSKLIKK